MRQPQLEESVVNVPSIAPKKRLTRDRATQQRDFLVSTGASVVVCVLALQEWMPHPHRDANFIENASLLMAVSLAAHLAVRVVT